MRQNRTPQDDSYNFAKLYSKIEALLYLASFILSIVQHSSTLIPDNYFLIITGIIIVSLFSINRVKVQTLGKANDLRRKFFFDDAFDNKKLPHKNKEYFDNNDISGGLHKALANLHENSLFTSKITNMMLPCYWIKSSLILLAFLISLFCNGLNEVNSILLSFLLSGSIIIKTFNLQTIQDETNNVLIQANAICDRYEKTEDLSLYTSDILELLLKYEETLCGSEIILSDRIYNKINLALTDEWKELKNNYKIYS